MAETADLEVSVSDLPVFQELIAKVATLVVAATETVKEVKNATHPSQQVPRHIKKLETALDEIMEWLDK